MTLPRLYGLRNSSAILTTLKNFDWHWQWHWQSGWWSEVRWDGFRADLAGVGRRRRSHSMQLKDGDLTIAVADEQTVGVVGAADTAHLHVGHRRNIDKHRVQTRHTQTTQAHCTIGRVSYIRIYLCYFCFRWKAVSLVQASMQHLMHHVTVSLQQAKITSQNHCINNTSITQPTLSFYLWLKM